MRGVRAFGALVGLTALVAAGLGGLPAEAAGPPAQADNGLSQHAVCARELPGRARCHARVVDRQPGSVTPAVGASGHGYSPSEIKAAYGFPTALTAGAGQTIGIVDAFGSPSVQSDLQTFATTFGLPCNACLTVVDQRGGSNLPARTDWALEIALDVQWAHAVAPGAHILLVEADSNSYTDLLAGVDKAKQLGASYISLSWGSGEWSGETAFDSRFAGASVFASAGDAGLPASYPSSSPNVISVGGTHLELNTGGEVTSETGWSDGGGGCSAYESATAAQKAFSQYTQVNCGGRRATPDLSLVADPYTGVAVYDTTGDTGWVQVGGTSASAPMLAARAAVQAGAFTSSTVYGSGAPTFRDITVGNNGAACRTGFDLCTGRGTWADPGALVAVTATITSISCSGTSCTFTGTGTPTGATLAWTIDGAFASNQPSFTTSLTVTSHTVTLTATDGTRTSSPDTATVKCASVKRGKKTTTTCTATL